MQTYLLEAAAKVFPLPQTLVNIISQRVRQLSQGSRPMVEVDVKWGYSDIALKEVIDGKLSYESNGVAPVKETASKTSAHAHKLKVA